MYDILADPKALAICLLGGFVTLIAWIGRRELKRLDELDENAVRREEMETFHRDNVNRLDGIQATVESTHRRIDDIYRDLLNKRP